MDTALPTLLWPRVYMDALSPGPFPTSALTSSRDDVDHAFGNASLQCQLCKLQGCEWGHLKEEQWGMSVCGGVWMQDAARPPFIVLSQKLAV